MYYLLYHSLLYNYYIRYQLTLDFIHIIKINQPIILICYITLPELPPGNT